jgi:diguanylate cyclase (GGDEF)-like protein/PAS domain S-box-containing protein
VSKNLAHSQSNHLEQLLASALDVICQQFSACLGELIAIEDKKYRCLAQNHNRQGADCLCNDIVNEQLDKLNKGYCQIQSVEFSQQSYSVLLIDIGKLNSNKQLYLLLAFEDPALALYVQEQYQLNSLQWCRALIYSKIKNAVLEQQLSQDEAAMENDLQLIKFAFDHALEAIVILDHHRLVIGANQAALTMHKLASKQVIGKSVELLYSPSQDYQDYEDVWQQVEELGSWRGELLGQNALKKDFQLELSLKKVSTGEQEHPRYIAMFSDISEHKVTQKRLKHLAMHDPLTGQLNRRALVQTVERRIIDAKHSSGCFAVYFIDIDMLKEVNNLYSQHTGDLLLKAIAIRLQDCIEGDNIIARYGGDEFVIITPVTSDDQRMILAKPLLSLFAQPFFINDIKLEVNASIGVSLYPDSDGDVDNLLNHAYQAMHQVKLVSGTKISLYDSNLESTLVSELNLKAKLKQAIDDDKLMVYYQPISNANGTPDKLEALVRWSDQAKQMISPEVFIPVAEKYNLIDALGRFVLETACKDLAHLHQLGFKHITVSVNRSIKEFSLMPTQAEFILATIARYNLAPSDIIIELTESSEFVSNPEIERQLQALAKAGVKLALDDFGTGFSSLSYLIDMDVDVIKIDRSFVRNIEQDEKSQKLVSTVINLAKSLNMAIVAEGVEEQGQFERLLSYGCDYFQGYLFSRALPLSELLDYINNQGSEAALQSHKPKAKVIQLRR